MTLFNRLYETPTVESGATPASALGAPMDGQATYAQQMVEQGNLFSNWVHSRDGREFIKNYQGIYAIGGGSGD